ncbi:MAG: hypothetical protein SGI97_02995 [candidate division Zixibacteria bacterium]|nr:hypothetical protein [candidate division Zixibacteria bacterium]
MGSSTICLSTIIAACINRGPAEHLDHVAAIIDSVQSIELSLGGLEYVRATDDFETDEGVELVGYFDGNALRKITADGYGAITHGKEEYYYIDSKLIFVNVVSETYARPYYEDSLGPIIINTDIEENYLYKDTLIHRIANRDTMSMTDSSRADKTALLMKRSKECTQLLRTAKDTIDTD